MIIDLAASVAIIRGGQVLLTKRSDVEAWTLPGGRVESGESVVQAAIREAQEETGFQVQLTRLVGIYYLPEWKYGSNHEVLFAAKPIGGTLRPQPSEVAEEAFFDPQDLPSPLLWWQRQRIHDAMSGIGGSVVWMQRATWPFKGEELHERLSETDASKEEFLARHFSMPAHDVPADLEVLLVGGAESGDDICPSSY